MAATGRYADVPQGYDAPAAGDPRHYTDRREYIPNGAQGAGYEVSRAASQRRGKTDDDPYDAIGLIYTSPDSPSAARSQYRRTSGDQYSRNGSSAVPSSRSFAARAGAIPAQLAAPPIRSDSYMVPPVSAPRQHVRRLSEGQSGPLNYTKPHQSRAAAYATVGETASNMQVSNGAEPKAGERRDHSLKDNYPNQAEQPRAIPVRSSTMSSAVMPNDWAADRSPLQKLEVKLNDISKEEKRARVQEAEQRLREAKAHSAVRQASQKAESTPQRSGLRRATSETNKLPPPSSRAPEASRRDNPSRDALARRNLASPPKILPQSALRAPERGPTTNVASATARRTSLTSRDPDRPRRSIDAGRGDERAVRFYDDDNDLHPVHKSPRSERPVTQPTQETSRKDVLQRSDSIQAEDQGMSVVPRPAAGREHAFKHDRHLKHQLPPQTAAGVQTRQQVGFERDLTVQGQPPEHHHHLPDFIRRHHRQPDATGPTTNIPRLEEWKTAETARLTLEDATAPTATPSKSRGTDQNVPWWEDKPSQGRRKGSAEAEFTAFDGAQEDSNGMMPRISLEHRRTSIATARNNEGPVRARQYIGYEGTSKAERRNRSWLRCPASIIKQRLGTHVARTLTFSYSYACAVLSEHDPSVANHLCRPYVSKELMKTMRAIRVRAPIEPTVFTPPLLLKCGPLLRYTGLRRDISASSQPDRETWRGSVMIVTTDSQSVYEPAPVLRVFHQPMELLPPPPTHFDESNDQDLPYEYIDPVGGLPKMTRTGGTVYVKPAEDLDHGRDVSQIEDDDGLYEFTRTANVPTKYGKADELLGRSPLPALGSPRQRKPAKGGRFREVKGIRLHAEHGVTFWRFTIEVELGPQQSRIAYRINKGASIGFWVPARGQSMNIMFHSCNGFSMSVEYVRTYLALHS